MITLQTTVSPHPEVITTRLDNQETVLLHLHTQQYYTLNETGSRIWEALAQAQALSEIGQILEAGYDLTLAQAQQHVLDLVETLVQEQLVQVVGAS